ncbi:maleylpyruvate isomerase family mycothiol-dependent enzyme [Gordonia zhaorongruii]|uniref:maleylpyruvate isomerase family mycothiol-dependent enzyme n=1 Tax=Gordonia zhaorongruii TaxID=2597659 RepID=UPI00104D565F
MDARELARDQRLQFADVLSDLDDSQWDAPTLCAGWCVRDVAAHVISYLNRSVPELLTGLVQSGGSLSRLNDTGIRDVRNAGPEDLCYLMRKGATPRGVGVGFGGRVALVECVIHQLDVCRPLGILAPIPAERLRTSLDFARLSPVIRGGWHTRGTRLVATDLDWATGYGAQHHDTAENLLLEMSGRTTHTC